MKRLVNRFIWIDRRSLKSEDGRQERGRWGEWATRRWGDVEMYPLLPIKIGTGSLPLGDGSKKMNGTSPLRNIFQRKSDLSDGIEK